jgi:transcriptional regulator with XRE-family HTH domain
MKTLTQSKTLKQPEKKLPPEQVHIGKLIRRHLEEIGMTKSEFARRLDTSPQNIYGIFKRESCDSKLLFNISKILNINLLEYYHSDKVRTPDSQLASDNERLTKELEISKQENDYLKEINQLLREKKTN